MTRIVAQAGDTLDYLCWRHYGATDNRVVETVLQANPGLAALGPVLPAGTKVQMPEMTQPAQTRGLRLWD